jgi:hypothetical protein
MLTITNMATARNLDKFNMAGICRGGRGNGGQWVMPVRHFSDKRQQTDAFSWCCQLVLGPVKCESEFLHLLLVQLPR